MREDAKKGHKDFRRVDHRSCCLRNTGLASLGALSGILLFLGGCAVGPDYVKPSAPSTETYKEMGSWKIAEPKDEAIKGKWWEIFNDAELNRLEEQVNISNQNVIQAEAQYRQAKALVQAARAGYFPAVSAGTSFDRSLRSANTNQSLTSTSGGTSANPDPVNDFLASGSISWELDVWGRVRRAVESGRAGAQASLADLESIRLAMQADLAQNYFQLRALDGQKRLLDATVAAYQKSLQLTQNRYGSGVASRADVLQAQTQLKTTQAQAIDIGVTRAQLEHAIAVLTGQPPAALTIAAAPLTGTPPVVPVALPSVLLERRPDIAAAERRVAQANAQIGVATAAFFPSVSLSASGGYESASTFDWFKWPSHFWSFGPTIAQSIFEGGLRYAQLKGAKAQYDGTVAAYRSAVLTGFQEVEDNLAALRILEEEARVQDEAVQAARQSLSITTNQYKEGLVSYLSVIVAQTTTLSNERTAVDILGRRMTASVLLVKALGGGWDPAVFQTEQ